MGAISKTVFPEYAKQGEAQDQNKEQEQTQEAAPEVKDETNKEE